MFSFCSQEQDGRWNRPAVNEDERGEGNVCIRGPSRRLERRICHWRLVQSLPASRAHPARARRRARGRSALRRYAALSLHQVRPANLHGPSLPGAAARQTLHGGVPLMEPPKRAHLPRLPVVCRRRAPLSGKGRPHRARRTHLCRARPDQRGSVAHRPGVARRQFQRHRVLPFPLSRTRRPHGRFLVEAAAASARAGQQPGADPRRGGPRRGRDWRRNAKRSSPGRDRPGC